MKKLITICLLVVAAFTVNAQTEEETISWLKEKFEKNLVPSTNGSKRIENLKVDRITSCEIQISFSLLFLDVSNSSYRAYKLFFPCNGIKINLDKGTFYYSAEKILIKVDDKDYYQNDSGNNFSIRNAEEDFYKRIQTALDHLATFCPKIKETF